MTKKKAIMLIITILFLGLLVTTGSYALWSWNSNTNKRIAFNIAKGLENYIVYDAGESKFIGNLEPTNSFSDGMHTTISFYKTGDAVNVPLTAEIRMYINSLGDNIKESPALKWKLTVGDDTHIGATLAQGNFIMQYATILYLATNIDVPTTLTKYTVWIWLDASENPSDALSGEALDAYIYTNFQQKSSTDYSNNSRFMSNNSTTINQRLNVILYDNIANITKYAITTTYEQPALDSNVWVDIPLAEQSGSYIIDDTVNSPGTYYIWFIDATGYINGCENCKVTVNNVDTSGPVCSFGAWSRQYIGSGEKATINLTCTDDGSKLAKFDLKTSDITTSNNYITVNKIVRSSVTNGYSYAITVTGTDGNNLSHITLPANKITNLMGYSNTTAIDSGDIHLTTTYQITLNNANATTNGTSMIYERYGRGFYLDNNLAYKMSTIVNPITIPERTGWSFAGYYDNTTQIIKGNGTLVSDLSTTQYSASKTLTASWVDDIPPTGSISLSYNNPTLTVTVSASDNGGVGINGYGYKLSTNPTCDSTITTFNPDTLNTYNFTVDSNDPQYVCVRVEDTNDNAVYISEQFTPS